jgi:cardiolipin synthase
VNAAPGGFERGLAARARLAPAASLRLLGRPAAGGPAPCRLAHALTRQLGQPLAAGHRVVPLFEAEAAEAAVLRAIDAARDHLHLASALSAGPAALERLVDRLLARARAGVRINLLLGARDARSPWPEALAPLRRAGVALCADESGAARRLGVALGAGERHELLVVDGRLAFVDHVVADGPRASAAWQVAGLQVEGPVVAQLQSLFVERWRRVADRPLQPGRHFPPLPPLGPQRVGLAAGDPGRGRAPLRQVLHGALLAAQRRIVLAVRDGDPGPELQAALEAAAARGVDVRLMRPAPAGRRWAVRPAPFTLHERPPSLGPTPSNLCVVDGLWCALGATRLDGRGWLHEASAALVVLDEGLAARLEALFEAEAARCGASGAPGPRGGGGGILPRLAAPLAAPS